MLFIAPCFEAQGGTSVIEPQTYVYYMQLATKSSTPSQGIWIPYDESIEQIMRDDFKRLLAHQLPRQPVDPMTRRPDYMFPNGTIGKIVIYNMEERERIKIGPDFEGSKKLELSKIDEALRLMNAEIRLDTFIDEALVRKVEGIVRDMMKEKGFTDAEVTHEIKPVRRRAEARAPDLQHQRGAQRQDPEDRLHRQHRDQRRHAEGPDEEHPGGMVAVLPERPRHLPGDQVRRGRGKDCRVLPEPGIHQGERRRA